MTAAGLVWELAGRPDCGKPTVEHAGSCYVCGEACTGGVAVKAKQALGVNFDHTRAGDRTSQHVCAACMWALSGKPPLTLRMWSGVAADGRVFPPNHPKCAYTGLGDRVHLTNRADMRAIAEILINPPSGEWCVWIAVSGQKHVLPYTALNRGPGRWAVQIEDTKALSDPVEFAAVLARVIRLRLAGFPESTILEGNPGTWIDSVGRLTAWKTWGQPLEAFANSPLLQLACMIPTKGTIDDLATRYGQFAEQPPADTPTAEPGTDQRRGAVPTRGDLPRPDDELRLF